MKADFCKILTCWYLENKRDLPWRKTKDSYVIWLSEIILQQTRVSQGLPYFLRFIEQFPTVSKLANASEEEVLKLWQGLGYYSRARNLHTASKMVIENFNGKFPVTYKELIKLKGVGVYTASAIASFSNNEQVAVVDGNVYRVLARIYGVFTPINSTEGEKEFKKLADSLLSKENPADHNQAIMEFGALACTPKKASCATCPFSKECYAYINNVVDQLPVKIKKLKIRKRYFTFVVVRSNERLLVQKRSEKDIWQHLYQFPLIESQAALTSAEAKEKIGALGVQGGNLRLLNRLVKPHKLSHQHIFADFYEIEVADFNNIDTSYVEIPFVTIDSYPVPVLISNFLKDYVF